MSEPLPPKSIEELAAGYVLGDLEPEEAQTFEQLLAEQPELIHQVNGLQNTLEHLLQGLNEVQPPSHLRAAIVHAANRPTPQISPLKRHAASWKPVMASVAALLILYLGVDNYRLRQNLIVAQQVNTLLQQSETRLFSLQGMKAAKQAEGSFVMNLEQQTGILAIQNLPAPPIGQSYRLWAVVKDEKFPCGQVTANAQGSVLAKFSMPADFYEAGISGLLVTLEPSQSARYPIGPVVMRSSL